MASFDPFFASSSFTSSSSFGSGSTLGSYITSIFFPASSGTMTNVSPAAMNSVMGLQRREMATSLSLSRAALGWTTTVAISLMLVQWVGNKDKKKTTPLDWITRMLSTLWSDQRALDSSASTTETAKSGAVPDQGEEMTVLLNRGSCHCGAITFKLTPAREVRVIKNPHSGKLQYPTARVPSDQLHLISGKHLWNTYHVRSEETGETWAYSFCKRCAIHLLHATDADQSSLFVNLQCFNGMDGDIRKSHKNSFVPHVLATPTMTTDGEDSVATKTSVISTVTAATQKSLLTTVTALPDYANPRNFGRYHQFQQPGSTGSSGGEDVTDADSASPVERVQSRVLPRPRAPRLPSIASPATNRGWKDETMRNSNSLSRDVLAYSATGSTRTTFASHSPSLFREGPVAPKTAAWPIVDEGPDNNGEDGDPDNNGQDDDDKDSISTNSGDLDYFSASTMEGNTSASTAATSTTSSSIDYNITANRERMLHNMRKHLKSSKTTTI